MSNQNLKIGWKNENGVTQLRNSHLGSSGGFIKHLHKLWVLQDARNFDYVLNNQLLKRNLLYRFGDVQLNSNVKFDAVSTPVRKVRIYLSQTVIQTLLLLNCKRRHLKVSFFPLNQLKILSKMEADNGLGLTISGLQIHQLVTPEYLKPTDLLLRDCYMNLETS